MSVAWSALFFGQARFVAAGFDTEGGAELGSGEYYQLGWMFLAGLILITLILNSGFNGRAWKMPIVAFMIYAILGIVMAGFSPMPLFSVYKASQVLMLCFVMVVAYTIIVQTDKPRILLELSYFWLTLIVAGAALGGVFNPENAFSDIYGGGVFGVMLLGTYPKIHANELGLLAAIMVVVSFRRVFEVRRPLQRFYWGSLAFLAFSVLFAAQARTSIFLLTLSLIALSIFIRKLRWFAAVLIILSFSLLSYYLVTGSSTGYEGTVETYLKRGSSEHQLETLSGRTVLWGIGWEMLKDKPITGHGFEAGVRFGGTKYGLPSGTNMHSAHMQVLVNSGVLGYIFWALCIFSVVWITVRTLVTVHLPVKKENDSLYVEATIVLSIIFLRSFAGQVLVSQAFSLLTFLAVYLYTITSSAGRKKDVKRPITQTSHEWEGEVIQKS